MKIRLFVIYMLFQNCAFCQILSDNHFNEKVENYHLGLNSSKFLISQGKHKLALIQMIEVLNLNLNYGDDAFMLLSGFIENSPYKDSSYLVLLGEYSLKLSECGVKWGELRKLYDIANKNWRNFKNDSILPNFQLSYNVIKASDILDKKSYKNIYKSVSILFNRKLSKEIDKIGRLDQKNRHRSSNKSFENDSIVAYKLKKMVFENEGFPSFKTIGKEGYEIIETCLIHMEMEGLVELMPYAIKSIRNGDMFINDGFLYALDRISIEEGKYLAYENEKYIIKSDTNKLSARYYHSGLGGFYCYNRSNKKQRYLIPISEQVSADWVNDFRKLIYLPSIEESIQIHHINQLTDEELKTLDFETEFRINTYL